MADERYILWEELYMKLFTYGFNRVQMDAIRWHFGKEEYIDVTEQYQDILALNADMVIVSLEFGKSEEIDVISEYEQVTKDVEARNYIYVTEEMRMEWYKDMYDKLLYGLKKAASLMTVEQFKMLTLFYIHKNKQGYISRIESNEKRKIIFLDFYRPELQTTELIIMSYGDDSISKTEYNEYMSHGEYDRVSVDWYKEINKEQCLEQLFYDRTRIEELPPLLKPIKEKLDEYTAPFIYAVFGEE